MGAVSRKDAETAQNYIDSLIKARKTGGIISPAVQEWLCGITDGLRDRLEKLGLVETKAKSRWTVAGWLADYIERRTNAKSDTRRKLQNVQKRLEAFFQNDTVEGLTAYQAKNYRAYLKETVGLAENTIRRHIGMCRQFFNAAIDAGIIAKNPFAGQPVTIRPNKARLYYVSPQTAQSVLQACPDAEWRLIFGLARFGGLRCPSEILQLRWTDIDFEQQRFTVHSPKTEHHADGGVRIVPMFPELKPLFQDAFDNAREGAVYCIERYRGGKVNLRTHLTRIIKRAGLDVWPKLFQNCRSTRETELFKQTGGNVKAVCSWIGNSPEIALVHYAQITDADMAEAAKRSVLNDAAFEVVQNMVQNTAETTGNKRKEQKDKIAISAGNSGLNSANADFTKANQWAGVDSNHRKLSLMDLQSIPFSLSGTYPFKPEFIPIPMEIQASKRPFL